MSADAAYRSSAAQVLADWDAYQAKVSEISEKRRAMGDRFGRRLMVSTGWGHSSRVVGFEVLDGEEDGLVVGDNGEIRIPKKGPPYNTATPNLRRKAGKDLHAELQRLYLDGPEFAGMPSFMMVGFHMLSPALFKHDGAVWARWAEPVENIDAALWESVPLSTYYAAKEAYDAAEVRP